jgi:hypothetical protein
MDNSYQTNKADDVVAQFPGPVTLVRSRAKWWTMVILGVGMTTASIWVASAPFISSVRVKEGSPYILTVIGLFGAAFFGLATAVGVKCLLPNGSFLRLDENGFEAVYPFRKQRFRWTEVSDFTTFRAKISQYVSFRTTKPLNFWMRLMASLVAGRDGSLPDTYGLSASELMEIMIAWQNLAIRQRG